MTQSNNKRKWVSPALFVFTVAALTATTPYMPWGQAKEPQQKQTTTQVADAPQRSDVNFSRAFVPPIQVPFW